ncbi:hypothetical protein B0H14DRAFT_3889701 [Mycena olivaceomarginata]|nr:hypothetical protein B0H14DRAFT_3889701 [Mycena olivaceomarginata]
MARFKFPVNANVPIESAKERAERRKQAGTYKRLLIFCDGTGQQTDAPAAYPEKKTWAESARVVAAGSTCCGHTDVDYTKDGKEIEQMSFYQNGVATDALTALGETWSGAFGVGLNENVCEAYVWLCLNWIPGDEIFIFGFSRGAFTARALSGLIFHLGIIDRSNLGEFHSIYDAYTKPAEKPNHDQTWKSKQKELQDGLGCSDLDIVKVKVVGMGHCQEGLPENERVRRWIEAFGWDRKHAFHDAHTCENVENAFQALALDEKRAAFSPTLWSLPSSMAKTHLQQCWFPGAHSDVGVSYADAQPFDSSDLSLMWMIRQCRPFLAFNNKRLEKELEPYTFQFYLNGQQIRRPAQYPKMQNGHEVGPFNESVHMSVRLRLLRARMLAKHKEDGGPVVATETMGLKVDPDKEGSPSMVLSSDLFDNYDCKAMAGFRLELVDPSKPGGGYKWVKGKVELMEDQLGEDERNMLDKRVRELLDDPAKNVGLEFLGGLHAAKTPGM